ncbi:MAG: hypothetical protein BWX86_01770 [Verrucomicrobia bacterium ADurb.Bin122]|nr:MAG: hypothetical protein BWX86_01770 [Verrucomicrobia bacterium ADurb.Bin122]
MNSPEPVTDGTPEGAPPTPATDITEALRPTRARVLIGLAIAIAAFFLPQEIPLEYYPLNNPSSGLQYLEIRCASNFRGNTSIYLDTGKGFNELDKILWPIAPSEMAFTYTFPLPDAPLFRLRLDPIDNGAGELRVPNFRLINRREQEILRFGPDSFTQRHQIESVTPLEKGFTVTVTQSDDPWLLIDLAKPLAAEGMNERNLKRCLLSTGYLTFMLWLILLAAFFALRPRGPWKRCLPPIAFLLFLAALFAVVGNRGLIRNSARYAWLDIPQAKPASAQTAPSAQQ